MILNVNKKHMIILLMVLLVTIGCFLWFGELGTNKEIPKKAKFVGNFLLEGDNYR